MLSRTVFSLLSIVTKREECRAGFHDEIVMDRFIQSLGFALDQLVSKKSSEKLRIKNMSMFKPAAFLETVIKIYSNFS